MIRPELRNLIERLRADGVRLWVQGGILRYSPPGTLRPDQVAVLRRHKADVIGLLQANPSGHPGLAVPGRPDVLPLSYRQEGLWFIHKLEPGPAYNVGTAIRIQGQLDLPAFDRALGEIIRRHEILRTRFQEIDGALSQIVLPWRKQEFDVVPITADAGWARVQELIESQFGVTFDLEHNSPLTLRILQLGGLDHVLVITAHHILFDASSLSIFMSELFTLYKAYLDGMASPLPELAAQYGDYTIWERRWLESGELAADLAYWKDRLAGAPEALDLPVNHLRPSVASAQGEIVTCMLPGDLSDSLKDLARKHDATPSMILLACFQALLSRWSGQRDIAVGVPIDGRAHPEAEGLIGYFVSTVVIRTDLSGNPAFTEIVRQVRTALIGAYEHRHLPFGKLVAELHPERDPARQPLFQVGFSFHMAKDYPSFSGLMVTDIGVDSNTSKFELSLYVTDVAGGMRCDFEYATGLFERATIERFARYLIRLAQGAALDAETRLADLPFLPDAERHMVLTEWNATEAKDGSGRCLHEAFAEQAALRADAPAVVFDGGVLSYAEVNGRANQVAHRLLASGVGPETIVGICAERSPELVVGMLGVLKAGAAYLPLDPSYPAERLAFMISDSAARIVLAQRALGCELPASGVMTLDAADEWAGWSREDPAPQATPDNLAYVIYTSGSTGQPKGVTVTHRAIWNYLDAMQGIHQLDVQDAMLQHTPISFDPSVAEVFWPLLIGGRLVLAAPWRHRDPRYLARLITEQRVTTAYFVPSMLEVFLPAIGSADCRSLRRVICGGETLAPELAEAASTVLNCELHNVYGPTEAAIDVSAWRYEVGGTGSVPIGRPLQNTQLYVLDEYLLPVPIGVAGQLYAGGVQLARGYHGRPALTAENFLPHPYGPPGSRLYRTGDLARFRPDGAIEFLGRVDRQVKVRGYRIELGEIESILRQYEGVAEAIVMAREDTSGDQRLVGYVVAVPHVAISPAALQAFVGGKVPAYMVPSAIVVLPELPLTPNEKVDREALPVPDFRPEAVGRAPSSGLEQTLSGLFAEVLGLPAVGTDDSFFTIGGHSLLAIRLIDRLSSVLGTKLDILDIFEAPTVADLAGRLAGLPGHSESPPGPADGGRVDRLAPSLEVLLSLRTGGNGAPLFCVHPAAGIGWVYSGLVPHLRCPVYALQARGLAGHDTCTDQIGVMAEDYLAEIRAIQPTGPYRLLGWSFGGLVAHEMAVRLKEGGAEVSLLAMMDSYPPATNGRRRQPLTDQEATEAVLESLDHKDDGPAWLGPDYLAMMARAFTSNFAAQSAHRPRAFDGALLFFVATLGRGDDWPAPTAWQPFVTGPIDLHEIECAHGAMTRPAALAQVGPVLAARLSRDDS